MDLRSDVSDPIFLGVVEYEGALCLTLNAARADNLILVIEEAGVHDPGSQGRLMLGCNRKAVIQGLAHSIKIVL